MAPNNDIENQFSSAVKSALDASGPVAPPSEAPTSPATGGPPEAQPRVGRRSAMSGVHCGSGSRCCHGPAGTTRRRGAFRSRDRSYATKRRLNCAGRIDAGWRFEPDDCGHNTGADRRCAGFNGEYQQRTGTTLRYAVGSFAPCRCVAARTPACGYVKESLSLSSNAPSSFSGRASFCPWSPVSFVKPIRKGAKPGL